MKILYFLLIIIILSGCASSNMKLTSNDFKENENLSGMFTCDGKNINPHLKWSDFPKETKSFALTLIDPDAPSGNFIHWLVYDIPKDVNEIEQNSLPIGAKEVENDARRMGYFGPCPPSGTHRYIFTVYALKAEHLDNLNKGNFVEIIEKNKLDSAKLIGLYKRI